MYKGNFLRTSIRSIPLSLKPLAVAATLFVMAGQAHATVNGGTVAAGAATINTNGAITTIDQSTDRAVINWKGFDIGAGEAVQINQPSKLSAILNRVSSTTATHIDGELNANGQVFVVNPNGVVVGKSGHIDANGVVLSTLNVDDRSFMVTPDHSSYGTYLFFNRVASASEASVVNDGSINAGDAGISLFGSQVINGPTGTLRATGNTGSGQEEVTTVNLIAADSITATQLTNNGYNAAINGLYVATSYGASSSSNAHNLAANDGVIEAHNGPVTLLGVQNGGAESARNTGSITASDSTNRFYNNSVVSLGSGDSGATNMSGSIHAAGQVSLASHEAPLTVDGSIISQGRIDLNAYGYSNPSLANLNINAGANLDTSNVLQAFAWGGGALSVNGDVTAGLPVTFGGDGVQVRPGSVHAPYYEVFQNGQMTRY